MKLLLKEELSYEAKRALIRGAITWQIRTFPDGGEQCNYKYKGAISENVKAEFNDFKKSFDVKEILTVISGDGDGTHLLHLYYEGTYSVVRIDFYDKNHVVSVRGMYLYTKTFDAEQERRVELPAMISDSKYYNIDDSKKVFDALGIQVVSEDTEAELVDVILPKNWFFMTDRNFFTPELPTTGLLYDEQLRQRAHVVFNGEDSEIRFLHRYNFNITSHETLVDGKDIIKYEACLTDCGVPFKTIYEWEKEFDWDDDDDENGEKGWKMCFAYLNEHFPRWQDILAYWNEGE